ncbi:hypothetical protein B296_00003264 [Ensete ventricosum]|uniref:Transmembrane protein n=1 Tax=Ensete ventricosum TaxID=4639 RepID=A0A427B8J2_ENSVE|nr:hypothetical protein B296_00003264 [Ensete ventricosum]
MFYLNRVDPVASPDPDAYIMLASRIDSFGEPTHEHGGQENVPAACGVSGFPRYHPHQFHPEFEDLSFSLSPFLAVIHSISAISILLSFFAAASSSAEPAASTGSDTGKRGKRSFGRKLFQIGLISLTGGGFLSGLKRGKRSFGRKLFQIGLISLTGGVFLSGLNDLAIFHGCSRYQILITISFRTADERSFSFLRHHDWDILIMDALLHIPSNDEKHQTVRISLSENSPLPSMECKECRLSESATPEK